MKPAHGLTCWGCRMYQLCRREIGVEGADPACFEFLAASDSA
ncbi:MAG TPA: hypothetical protein PKY77_20235 [Phycisphaerae bacterium]|nr:hypothetical protein [Phycisphaerae bacterium]HRY71547.1 hypothetical protein [Phycisphaerae bacterium]HSA29165.1 hypothetical protein [Phycisphaerae bacterium]